MDTTQETRLFVKQGKSVRGPFPVSSLQSMQKRKSITRSTLVSESRGGSWVSAESLPDVFPDGNFERRTPITHEEMLWFYAAEGSKVGPVPFLDLQQLVEQRQIAPYDNVMSETMTTWVSADSIPELGLNSRKGPAVWSRKQFIIGASVLAAVVILPAAGVLVADHWRIGNEQQLAEEEAERQRLIQEDREQKAHELEIATIGAEGEIRRGQLEADAVERGNQEIINAVNSTGADRVNAINSASAARVDAINSASASRSAESAQETNAINANTRAIENIGN
jgi:hypothetical protein